MNIYLAYGTFIQKLNGNKGFWIFHMWFHRNWCPYLENTLYKILNKLGEYQNEMS